MRRPKCKLCQTEHYTHEPHKFADTPARSEPEADVRKRPRLKANSQGGTRTDRPDSKRADRGSAGHGPELVQPAQGAPDNSGLEVRDIEIQPGFDRTAYQREYMRDWRRKRTARLKELEAMLKAKEMLD